MIVQTSQAKTNSIPAVDLELPKLHPPRQQTIEQQNAWCKKACPADDDSDEARHVSICCNDGSCTKKKTCSMWGTRDLADMMVPMS